jgi:hypothetical protein
MGVERTARPNSVIKHPSDTPKDGKAGRSENLGTSADIPAKPETKKNREVTAVASPSKGSLFGAKGGSTISPL